MSHLMAIAVGPVQDFIAAARRTRDLWFGSYLLSEISRSVAASVEANGGKLIFPALIDTANVANVILAELPSGEPNAVGAKAKQAAEECWHGFAIHSRKEAGNAINDEVWKHQISDVIEFYAAWVSYLDSANYAEDRKRLMRLLNGRKNCRDFSEQLFSDVGVPKSSLDGQRASVLVQPKFRGERDKLRKSWPSSLRLSVGEELDVVGVTKRLGKRKDTNHPTYPSVARVAAETWLSGQEKQGELETLRLACEKLISKGLNTVREENYQYFPYEGTVVFKDRLTDLQNELNLQDADFADVKAALKDLRPEPNPYLAILVADGDKMGATISALSSPAAHRAFSQDLAGFAVEAERVVTSHNGVLVYAGGDDVLAFLPVDKCLSCARSLHSDFGKRLNAYGISTLSVGIGIGHFMDNLEDLLDYGRAAEKAAKTPDRNGLAVHLHKRGGAPIRVRANWNQHLDQRLIRFASLMNACVIPSKLPYELRAMSKLYENWPENADAAIQQDLCRLIAKKSSRSSESVRQALAEDLKEMNATKLLTFSHELLVARQIAFAMQQAEGHFERVTEVTS